MRNSIVYGDAICFALSPIRTKEIIKLVLNEFIPDYKQIPGDYTFNLATDQIFNNENEILEYLEIKKTEKATLYWNKESNNPDQVMVSAYYTSDEQLIFGLTVLADGLKEEKYLSSLKSILDSDTAAIYYNQFPEFTDGIDFKNKCNLKRKT